MLIQVRTSRVILVIALLLLCGCSSIAATQAKPEASCPSALSHEQLLDITKTEVTKRGGKFDFAALDIRVIEEGCDYAVVVTRVPPKPGAYYTVEISREGRVKRYLPGY